MKVFEKNDKKQTTKTTLTTTDTSPSDLKEHPPTNISNSPETSKEKTKREIQQLFEDPQFTEDFWCDDINQNKLTSDSKSNPAPLLPKPELPNNIKKHCFENPYLKPPKQQIVAYSDNLNTQNDFTHHQKSNQPTHSPQNPTPPIPAPQNLTPLTPAPQNTIPTTRNNPNFHAIHQIPPTHSTQNSSQLTSIHQTLSKLPKSTKIIICNTKSLPCTQLKTFPNHHRT